jgi:hypothetical protein
MTRTIEKTCRIEILTTLMDELCSPELTLARGKLLRKRLADLLTPAEAACKRLGCADGPNDDLSAQRWCAHGGVTTSPLADAFA